LIIRKRLNNTSFFIIFIFAEPNCWIHCVQLCLV